MKEKLIRGLQNPELILSKIVQALNKNVRFDSETDVMTEDWDNLIILDACRYDVFADLNTISGQLDSVISQGSSTHEFLKKTFTRDAYPEVVYISANANITLADSAFHDRIRVWEDNWNQEFDTVLPETMVSEAQAAAEKYPNKRLIIHFIQPHYPFIGELGQRLKHKGQFEHPKSERRVWKHLEDRKYARETVWEAYRENLELALPAVQTLTDSLVGKTVVTSDHGNEFGWLGLYGHPGGQYTTNLKKVPWLVIEGQQRKEITAGDATEGPMDKTKSIEEKLEQLGYLQ